MVKFATRGKSAACFGVGSRPIEGGSSAPRENAKKYSESTHWIPKNQRTSEEHFSEQPQQASAADRTLSVLSTEAGRASIKGIYEINRAAEGKRMFVCSRSRTVLIIKDS